MPGLDRCSTARLSMMQGRGYRERQEERKWSCSAGREHEREGQEASGRKLDCPGLTAKKFGVQERAAGCSDQLRSSVA